MKCSNSNNIGVIGVKSRFISFPYILIFSIKRNSDPVTPITPIHPVHFALPPNRFCAFRRIGVQHTRSTIGHTADADTHPAPRHRFFPVESAEANPTDKGTKPLLTNVKVFPIGGN